MPSSLHARRMRSAISPRLAMTTFSSMGVHALSICLHPRTRMTDEPREPRILPPGKARATATQPGDKRRAPHHLFDDEERLTKLHRLAIIHQHRLDRAGLVRLDLVHHLHRFDDAQRVAN